MLVQGRTYASTTTKGKEDASTVQLTDSEVDLAARLLRLTGGSEKPSELAKKLAAHGGKATALFSSSLCATLQAAGVNSRWQ